MENTFTDLNCSVKGGCQRISNGGHKKRATLLNVYLVNILSTFEQTNGLFVSLLAQHLGCPLTVAPKTVLQSAGY